MVVVRDLTPPILFGSIFRSTPCPNRDAQGKIAALTSGKAQDGNATIAHLAAYARMEQSETRQTVLVVEDQIFIRMCLVASLEDAGLRVLEAGASAEALEILARHPEICVAVTDVRMPGAMDGLALACHLRRGHPRVRTLVVSGNASADQAYSAGASGFIAKPYLTQKLVETVLSLVPYVQAPPACAA